MIIFQVAEVVIPERMCRSALINRNRTVQVYPFSIYVHEKACCALLDEFLTFVRRVSVFLLSFSENAYTMQICLACIESYRGAA